MTLLSHRPYLRATAFGESAIIQRGWVAIALYCGLQKIDKRGALDVSYCNPFQEIVGQLAGFENSDAKCCHAYKHHVVVITN